MQWKDINDRAKRIVFSLISKLTADGTDQNDDNSVDSKDSVILNEFLEDDLLNREMEKRKKYDYHKGFQAILKEKRRRIIRRITAVACCIVFMFAIGIGWLSRGIESVPELQQAAITPAENRALLKLSSGEQVVLGGSDSLQIREGADDIRINGGSVAYDAQQNATDSEIRHNSLSVPRGGEYRIKLADGTLVHLNADSELKYPVAFAKGERRVYLKGEAWFEVAKESDRPFYVVADEVQIRVYGTTFNVNTHRLEVVQTVLQEGSIGISNLAEKGAELRMKPGQLSEYNRSSGKIEMKEINIKQYTAWREGIFYFDDESLEEIMYELARWYDVEVFFSSSKAKELYFSGHLGRYDNISVILNTITESTKVAFEIKNKTIIVK